MHCTPEQLALAALREPLPAADARHLGRCSQCRAQVAALQRGVDALTVPELAAIGPGVVPPPDVWSAIKAATGVQVTPRKEWMATEDGTHTPGHVHAPSSRADPASVRRLEGVAVSRSPAFPRFRRLVLATVASAVLGAAIALGAVTLAHRPVGSQVAAAPLHALEGSAASGKAVVVEHADHSLQLEVTLHGPRPASGYYEAWLADAGLGRMIAVGVLGDGTTTLPLPGGVDVGSYPVVDISLQQLDGNPAHSEHSIARGLLRR